MKYRSLFSISFLLIAVLSMAQSKDTLSFKYCSVCKNQNKSFGRKLLQGTGLSWGYQSIALSILYASPKSFSGWEKPSAALYRKNLKRAFTHPPVVDHDPWYVNYVGHPYQGAAYFNSYRSQGAQFWQAGLLSVAHSCIWEYLLEGGNEQPSIQDLIVTPIVGSLLGEGIHQATMAMSRNGFKWYEGIFVSIFNPMYAINNGFKTKRTQPANP